MNPKYITILAASFVFSCNNDDRTAPNQVGAADEEKQMIDNVNRFPDSSILTENLAQFYREENNYDKAIKVVENKITTDSAAGRWFKIAGILYSETGDTTKAISRYQQALELQPDEETIFNLGMLYATKRNPVALELAAVLQKAEKGMVSKESLFVSGLYYLSAGSPQKSISFFDQAIASNYTFMPAYRQKATALDAMKQYDKELEVLNRAITIQNNDPENYYYKALVLEKIKRPADAIESYKMILLYDASDEDARAAIKRLEKK